MKEDSAIYAFVIIVFSKWPPEALILAGKNGTHFFFTKSWSKNNFKPKNQFQQANPTGAQNLTLWPLLKSNWYGSTCNIYRRVPARFVK